MGSRRPGVNHCPTGPCQGIPVNGVAMTALTPPGLLPASAAGQRARPQKPLLRQPASGLPRARQRSSAGSASSPEYLPAVSRRGQPARRGCVLIAEAGFSVGRGGAQRCGYDWIWVGGVWRYRVCVGHDRCQSHNSHPQASGENGSGGQFCQFWLSGAAGVISGGHIIFPFSRHRRD
jgi:hypothetical protein